MGSVILKQMASFEQYENGDRLRKLLLQGNMYFDMSQTLKVRNSPELHGKLIDYGEHRPKHHFLYLH